MAVPLSHISDKDSVSITMALLINSSLSFFALIAAPINYMHTNSLLS